MPERRRDRLRRGRAGRDDAIRVLVVCGAKETEPNYFNALLNERRLRAAEVRVISHAFDPSRLVLEAKKMKKREQRRGEEYDHVFCVFDHDGEEWFDNASKAAEDAGIQLARSWPCFEFWFLSSLRVHAEGVREDGNHDAVRELHPRPACAHAGVPQGRRRALQRAQRQVGAGEGALPTRS